MDAEAAEALLSRAGPAAPGVMGAAGSSEHGPCGTELHEDTDLDGGGSELSDEGHANCVDLDEDPLWQDTVTERRQPFRPAGSVSPPATAASEVKLAKSRVSQAWESAQRLGQRTAVDPTPGEAFVRQMQAAARPVDHFRSGLLGENAEAWQHYFQLANGGKPLTKEQNRVMGMVRDGVRFKGRGAPCEETGMTPKQRKKRAIVTQMLRQARPELDPEQLLTGQTPHRVQFPNHRSAEENAEAVSAEVSKAVQMGAVAEWTADMGQPVIINGLRAVVSADGSKVRLCMNPMYPNLFMEIPPLKYESIKDVCGFVRKGDFLVTTDDKTGYWNLRLHPDMFPYVAFQWRGVVYYFPALAFGLAPACWVYSTLKRELFRPLRNLGMDLAFLIDDACAAARSRESAQFQCRILVELLTALGFTLSLNKCQLAPATKARFLGFIVDSETQTLAVPEDKVEALERLVQTLEARAPGAVTHRNVAQVAGKIMSMTLAVAMAPLHARVVGQALAHKASWDEAVGDPVAFLQRARMFLQVLRLKNGRTWFAKEAPLKLRLVGDASEIGTGGFLPDGELGEASSFSVPFTAAQLARRAANDFSSTEREVVAALTCLRFVFAFQPDLLLSRTVQYQTDSQAAMFCVLGMKGTPPCLRAVDGLLTWCAERDCELEVVWYPRTASLQQAADSLSKRPEMSQWSLNADSYRELWDEPCLRGRTPWLDAFADEATTKIPGRFFPARWSPNSLGIDALAHSGLQPPGYDGDGRPLVYINPPFERLGQIVRKLREEEPDCVLIAPMWPRWWRPHLRALPHFRACRALKAKNLFERVNVNGKREWHTPAYRVEAWYFVH